TSTPALTRDRDAHRLTPRACIAACRKPAQHVVCGLAAICPVVLGDVRRSGVEREKAQLIWIRRRRVADLDPEFAAAHAVGLAARVGRLLVREVDGVAQALARV